MNDAVRVEVSVPVPPAEAFQIFTEDIDVWWRRGPAYRIAGRSPGKLWFERHAGGRLFESYAGPDGHERLHTFGHITIWEPPARLAFEWRGINFAAHERTEIDVSFAASARGGTRVVVVHRGFAALPPDHPVRHGKPAPRFIADLGLWWGALMTALRERAKAAAAGRASSDPPEGGGAR